MAEDYRRKSLAIYRAVQDRQGTAVALEYLGAILAAQGRAEEAEESYRESRAIVDQMG